MSNIRFSIENDIGFLTFDVPNKSVNVLSEAVLTELDALLKGQCQDDTLKAIVFQSGKRDIFIAGADISEIEALTSPEKTKAMLTHVNQLFTSFSSLPCPTIAFIDGVCLGGGLELVLACDYRVVTDNPKVQLGAPEVKLGIIPGWGGTQRLPRLIGLQKALPLILNGSSINAKKALKLGIADRLVLKSFVHQELTQFIDQVVSHKSHIRRPKKTSLQQRLMENNFIGRSVMYRVAKKGILKKTKGLYPAPLAALKAAITGYSKSLEKGLDVEANCFAPLIESPEFNELVRLFFLQEKLKKGPKPLTETIKPITNPTVMGAGLMGGGIAWLFAYRGLSVRVKDIHWSCISNAYKAANAICGQLRKIRKIQPYEQSLIMSRMTGTVDWSGFRRSDLVVEAIVENMDIKKEVIKELESQVSEDTIIASNTSSLSITEMASVLTHPERFIGMHFFSPVNRMPLVEIIAGQCTSQETIDRTIACVLALKKIPIVVKNVPGFLVNRIFIPYVVEAVACLQDGVDVTTIDRIATDFGMPMGPLELADEVGLDVGYKVAQVLEEGYGERMSIAPIFHEIMKDENLRGKKTSRGFYIHAKGRKKIPNKPLLQDIGMQREHMNVPSDQDVLHRMMLIMVNEAAYCLKEGVVENADTLDMAMIMGVGFPPVVGGVCRYANQMGIDNVIYHLKALESKYGDRFKPAPLLFEMQKNKQSFNDLD